MKYIFSGIICIALITLFVLLGNTNLELKKTISQLVTITEDLQKESQTMLQFNENFRRIQNTFTAHGWQVSTSTNGL